MLALILSIGIPLAYVLAGMFISRSFWFKTRNFRIVENGLDCGRCHTLSYHRKNCIGKDGVTFRTTKTALLVFLWPIMGCTSGIGYLIRSFYHAPVRKLERTREKIEDEINVLRQGANEFERNTAPWQTMMDMISVKTKELKGMK